ncbi:hypothetical protein C8D92_105187 [Tamilnaduibacter salinus]|uniref:Uncharacterized protein n=1 Tax=Tamilnaduibacter salinus TaxID=1484056 RepID=A0A2U1CWX6_9GAMM|nr:hypothetical protein [Tamilnaduibacter salinus]PVY76434.1 hypothetical protein C8D92_105187 [Tamilnaduibacter salinus]
MTDEQYIEFIRKNHARRKLAGILGFLIIVATGIGTYFASKDQDQWIDDFLEADDTLFEGRAITEQDVVLTETMIDTAQSLGTENGIFMGHFMSVAVMFGLGCLVHAFGGRKDRLLLEYYDRAVSDNER